jgi:hypothetical protein
MTNHRILPALLASLLCLLSCMPLFAQQKQPTLSVRTMALNPGELPELFFRTKGKVKLTPVHWSTRQPSRVVLALYEGTLPLFRIELDEDGKDIPVVAHRVKVPAGAKEILLFAWLDKDKKKLKFHAIGDDFLKAKFNDWLLINLSSKSVDFIVGRASKPIRLNKGQSKTYQITAEENKGAAVMGKANIRGKCRIFYSTYLPVRSQRRTLVIFTDAGDKIRTTLIADLFNRRPKPLGSKP